MSSLTTAQPAFAELGLSRELLDAVAAQGYTTPTEVQQRAIPPLLAGRNLLATAQTGTGKTAAFTLPLLDRLAGEPSRRHGRGPARPSALILAPTRELAIQIDESVAAYGARSRISHTAIFGGAPKPRQANALRANPAVLAATPGRLLDFVSEGVIDLSEVAVFILDEADRMLDMGFIPDVRRIAKLVAGRKQTALLSATMPPEIESLARELLNEAERIAVAPTTTTADNIDQSVLHLRREDKIQLLPQLIRERNMFRVLVFTRTKHRAKRVARVLNREGIDSDELHGNRTQNQRQRALANFKSGKIHVLVGTDVAARGIDVDDVSHVINFEIPTEPETYVHRVGRTARAGSTGVAISLCEAEERGDLRQIERFLKRTLEVDRDHEYHVEPPSTPAAAAGRPAGGNGSGARGQSGARRGSAARPAGTTRGANPGRQSGGSRDGRGPAPDRTGARPHPADRFAYDAARDDNDRSSSRGGKPASGRPRRGGGGPNGSSGRRRRPQGGNRG